MRQVCYHDAYSVETMIWEGEDIYWFFAMNHEDDELDLSTASLDTEIHDMCEFNIGEVTIFQRLPRTYWDQMRTRPLETIMELLL